MKLTFKDNFLVIKREKSDPKFYGIAYAKGESRFLYHVKQKLNELGFDVIKKRMCKDGHLVDDLQQYLRGRKWRKDNKTICIYNDNFAVRSAETEFNRNGVVNLRVEYI